MTSTDKSDLFISILEGHKGIIHKVALAYTDNKEAKEDLVQEIVLQLWKSFHKYNPAFKYSTWIYRVALNVSLAASRKENNRAKRIDPLREEMLSVAQSEESTVMVENYKKLQEFISGLKELDRAIMLLYLEEKSQKEMAEIMGMTPTNISTRIGRIKDVLRQKFAELPQ